MLSHRELFKDGFGADGKRVYCQVNGVTCHQCRQKTLGHHTNCSQCQSKRVRAFLACPACAGLRAQHSTASSQPLLPALVLNSQLPIVSCCLRADLDALQGQFCGDCLFMRYGENVLEVAKNPAWACPRCRDVCNCSFCRTRKGWAPTGALYPRARQEGASCCGSLKISRPSRPARTQALAPFSPCACHECVWQAYSLSLHA